MKIKILESVAGIDPHAPHRYGSDMTVESTELESHLGEYLRQIRSTGETLTVCEHSEPVATLSPIAAKNAKNGSNLIDQLLANPAKVSGFQPLTRDEIYERR